MISIPEFVVRIMNFGFPGYICVPCWRKKHFIHKTQDLERKKCTVCLLLRKVFAPQEIAVEVCKGLIIVTHTWTSHLP